MVMIDVGMVNIIGMAGIVKIEVGMDKIEVRIAKIEEVDVKLGRIIIGNLKKLGIVKLEEMKIVMLEKMEIMMKVRLVMIGKFCDKHEEEVGNGEGNQICEIHEKNGNDCVMYELHRNDHGENAVNLDIYCGVNLVNDNHDGNVLVVEEEVVHAAKMFDKISAVKVFDNTSATGAKVADTRRLSMKITEVRKNEGSRNPDEVLMSSHGTRRSHGNGKFEDAAGHEAHGVQDMHGVQEDNTHSHGNADHGKAGGHEKCAYFDAVCKGNIGDYNRWVLALEKAVMVGEVSVEEEIVPATQVPDKGIKTIAAEVEVGASGSGMRNAGINVGIGASKKVSWEDMTEEEDTESNESSMLA